jgi:phage-related protein
VARTEAELNAMRGTAKVEVDKLNTLQSSIVSAIETAMSQSGLQAAGRYPDLGHQPDRRHLYRWGVRRTRRGGVPGGRRCRAAAGRDRCYRHPGRRGGDRHPGHQRRLQAVGPECERGQIDKAQQAMAKLAPSAQDLVIQVHALAPAWTALRLDVQQSLFAGVGSAVTSLASVALPILDTGLTQVATSMNSGLLATMNALQGQGPAFATTFSNIAASIQVAGGAAKPLVDAFSTLGAVGSQFLPVLAQGFVNVATAFNAWIQHIAETGQLVTIIQNALTVLKQLGELAINVGSAVGAIFTAAIPFGNVFLTLLVDLTGNLATFLHSADGQTALTGFFTGLNTAVNALLPPLIQLAEAIVSTLLPVIGQLAAALAPIAGQLLTALAAALQAIAPLLPPVVSAIAALASASAPLIPIISEIITTLLPPLTQIVAQLAPIIGELAQMIGEALLQAVQIIAPFLTQLGNAFVAILNALLPLVPPLLQLVVDLFPPLVTILEALLPAIVTVVNEGFVPLIAPLIQLVEALLPPFNQLLAALVPIMPQIAQAVVALAQAFLPLLPSLTDMVTTLLPPFISLITPLIELCGTLMVTALHLWADEMNIVIGVITTVMNAITSFISSIGPAWTQFWALMSTVATNTWNAISSFIQTTWNALASFFSNAWTALTAEWNAFWNNVLTFFQNIWNTLVAFGQSVWLGLSAWYSAQWAALSAGWSAFWNAVFAFFQSLWNSLVAFAEAVWNALYAFYSTAWAAFQVAWSLLWNTVLSFFQNIWNTLVAWAQATWTALANWFAAAWASFTAAWENFWNTIFAFFQNLWNTLVAWIESVWTTLAGWFANAWATFTAAWNAFWTAVLTFFQTTWNNLVAWVQAVWNGLVTWFGGKFDEFKALWGGVWDAVSTKFGQVWDGIRGYAQQVWEDIKAVIARPINFVINTVLNGGLFKGWNAVNDFLGLPWHINPLAPIPGYAKGGYTGEAGLFGTDSPDDPAGVVHPREFVFTANQVDNAGGPDSMYALAAQLDNGYAMGGLVRDNASDPQVHLNSYVVPPTIAPRINRFLNALSAGQAEAVQAAGGFDALGPGFFWGGYADALSAGKGFASAQNGKPYIWGGVGPTGYDCSGFQSAITNVLRGSTNPYSRVGSTANFPWAGFTSGLSGAYAIGSVKDAGGGIGHMAGTLGGVNVESGGSHGNVAYGGPAAGADASLFTIHATLPQVGGAFASGGGGGGSAPTSITIAGNIISAAADVLKVLTDSITGPIGNLLSTFGDNHWVSIMAELPKKLLSGLWTKVETAVGDAIKAAISAAGQFIGADISSTAPADKQGNVSTVQKDAAKYGWDTGMEWNDLVALINSESGFNNTAQNPHSTAYGMYQFLDSTWATVGGSKTSDPALQALYGNKYIQQRYRDPIGAWNHHQLYGSYDTGGWLPPGYTTVYNGTGGFEAVLNRAQQSAVVHAIDGRTDEAPVWHFYLGDREITDLVDARVTHWANRDSRTIRSGT